ncbi:alpha-amylase family glycosyl hydrolase [Pirellulaceae bacterium SH449]
MLLGRNYRVDAPFGSQEYEQQLTLKRLLPKLQSIWEREEAKDSDIEAFESRLIEHWPALFKLLRKLYGERYDFFYHLEQILATISEGFFQRSDELHRVDEQRIHHADWFQSEELVGGALYVDLFSENLGRLKEHIPYFKKLGLSYLHLMPLFAIRPGDNDGGYAISNYRSVDPRLGTIDDLRELSKRLRDAGILLVLDFVFNHTADDHSWAQEAKAGNPEYQDFYYLFPDRTIPDQYDRTLREIFPTVRRGNFSWHDGMRRWVWTTFNNFQWDLKYANPAVFNAMLGELLFIINNGIDVVRFDAVAFIWKRLGTTCENLPEAHLLIQAFRAATNIAAPGVLFKSEAIVHPDQVVEYVSTEECQISYNPTLMALCWESLATREVKLLRQSLSHRHKLPAGTAWVNYLRCHDDIGWTFDDADAAAVGIQAYDHRQFLNAFYTGQFPGSFARGIPFQQNEQTGDMRISGTMASLIGLEKAIEEECEEEIERSIRRILLMNSIILSIGGIPLLYIGEEWGTINDYDFVKDPAKSGDTRWVHRPKMRWDWLEQSEAAHPYRNRIYQSIRKLILLRRSQPALAGQDLELFPTDTGSVLGYVRQHKGDRLIVLANFSEKPSQIPANRLRIAGMGRFFEDVVSGSILSTSDSIPIEGYQYYWLKRN